MIEVWKDIKGYKGIYQISNMGRIKSLGRVIYIKNKKNRIVKDRIRKLSLSTHGYLFIALSKNNQRTNHKLHRLIAQHFIPNPENKPQVNHINGIKTDNSVENLEWCTHSENMRHALNTNLRIMPSGTNVYNSKLTDEIVIEARKKYAEKRISFEKLAKEYNVKKSVMMYAINGKNWKHLNEKYPPPKGKYKYKLTKDIVESILYSVLVNGVQRKVLMKKHNVSKSTITSILTGRNWPECYNEFMAKHKTQQQEFNQDNAV